MVSCNDVAVGAVAEAPFPIIKDAPAAPNAGKAILRRFRFEARFAFAMVEPFCAGQSSRIHLSIVTYPETTLDIFLHAQKSLRTGERIQITNDLVSNN